MNSMAVEKQEDNELANMLHFIDMKLNKWNFTSEETNHLTLQFYK